MGIKGLATLIKRDRTTVKLQGTGKYVVVDAMWWFHHSGSRKNELINGLELIVFFLAMGVVPIFCFDGKTPTNKQHIVERRFARRAKKTNSPNIATRYSYQPSRQIIDEFKEMCDAMGIPCITAQYEADAQMAKMSCELDGCVGVLTGDTDVLVHGGTMISWQQNTNYVEHYTVATALDMINQRIRELATQCAVLGAKYTGVDLGRAHLIDLAVLWGTDYSSGLRGAVELARSLGMLCDQNDLSDGNVLGATHQNAVLGLYVYYGMCIDTLIRETRCSQSLARQIYSARQEYTGPIVRDIDHVELKRRAPCVDWIRSIISNHIAIESIDDVIGLCETSWERINTWQCVAPTLPVQSTAPTPTPRPRNQMPKKFPKYPSR